jgi:hypothetical protein
VKTTHVRIWTFDVAEVPRAMGDAKETTAKKRLLLAQEVAQTVHSIVFLKSRLMMMMINGRHHCAVKSRQRAKQTIAFWTLVVDRRRHFNRLNLQR